MSVDFAPPSVKRDAQSTPSAPPAALAEVEPRHTQSDSFVDLLVIEHALDAQDGRRKPLAAFHTDSSDSVRLRPDSPHAQDRYPRQSPARGGRG